MTTGLKTLEDQGIEFDIGGIEKGRTRIGIGS